MLIPVISEIEIMEAEDKSYVGKTGTVHLYKLDGINYTDFYYDLAFLPKKGGNMIQLKNVKIKILKENLE